MDLVFSALAVATFAVCLLAMALDDDAEDTPQSGFDL